MAAAAQAELRLHAFMSPQVVKSTKIEEIRLTILQVGAGVVIACLAGGACHLPRCWPVAAGAVDCTSAPQLLSLLAHSSAPQLMSRLVHPSFGIDWFPAVAMQNMMEYHPESQEQLAWGSSAARSGASSQFDIRHAPALLWLLVLLSVEHVLSHGSCLGLLRGALRCLVALRCASRVVFALRGLWVAPSGCLQAGGGEDGPPPGCPSSAPPSLPPKPSRSLLLLRHWPQR